MAFGVEIGKSWRAVKLGGLDLTTYQGRVRICRCGPESDEFLSTLDRLYESQQRPLRMSGQTEFAGSSLVGDPTDLDAGIVRLKLVYEAEEEDRYAELYLDLDVGESRIEIMEKDPEYRTAVIRALTES